MANFKSLLTYSEFQNSVKREARYIFSPSIKKFLKSLKDTRDDVLRGEKILKGATYWRAQKGFDEERNLSYSAKRMKPKPDGPEGRVNPKGLPCLYLATDYKTAMAEVRPWIGSYLSVWQFKTLRDLNLIDLTKRHATVRLGDLNASGREHEAWAAINQAFSEPVTNETCADYAPTQILSELFHDCGYDGVEYMSSLGEGHNVALFSLDMADPIKGFLYKVEPGEISFNFSDCGRSIERQNVKLWLVTGVAASIATYGIIRKMR